MTPPDSESTDSRNGRHPVQWLAFALLLCVTPLFFTGGPDWTDGPLFKAGWNLGHVVFFALLTMAVAPWRYVSGWQLWLASTAAVLLFSAGIELVQASIDRQFDGDDVYRNLLGLWVVLCLRPAAALQGNLNRLAWPTRLLLLALLIVESGQFSRIAIDQFRMSGLTPQLYDFGRASPSDHWSGEVYRGDIASCGPDHGRSLTIHMTPGGFSGATLNNLPGNWHAFDGLELVLWNPHQQPLMLTLRINDRQHEESGAAYADRFNKRLSLSPGRNRIHQSLAQIASAPEHRQMDMSQIRRLMIFASDLKAPKQVCLKALRLTNSE